MMTDLMPQPRSAQEIRRDNPLLSPSSALRILRHRTGGHISRTTFYRWIGNGRIPTVRFGNRFYIRWQELDEEIRRCLNGADL